jgi:hypothetical protein
MARILLLPRHRFLERLNYAIPIGDLGDALDTLTIPFFLVQKDSVHDIAIVLRSGDKCIVFSSFQHFQVQISLLVSIERDHP